MRNERASIGLCMWDLADEEERHRLVDGIWDEMLQKNSPHTLATENNEYRDQTKAWHQKECNATDHGEKTQAILAYLEDGWQPVSEERGVWNHRWTEQERKTEKRVDGRHQRLVSDRRANTQHHSAGPFGVETSCHGDIGHQRVQAHGMKKKEEEEIYSHWLLQMLRSWFMA